MAGRDQNSNSTVALITGANSGLGYAIACRIIVEYFSESANADSELVVCLATRSVTKSKMTIESLTSFVGKALAEKHRRHLRFDHVEVDLMSLQSVATAAATLRSRYDRIHIVFCNAAMVPFVRIDWLGAARHLAYDFIDAMTFPRYKVQGVGWLNDANKTFLSEKSPAGESNLRHDPSLAEPTDLGTVFTANVFGHYYLVHEIMQTLRSPANGTNKPSRVIWIGSIESRPEAFDLDDIQGLRTDMPYESTKTLIDVLVLGSHLPENQQFLRSYTKTDSDSDSGTPPIFLVAHPGIVSTPIVALPWWQSQGKLIGFWICTLLGSPWHCIDPYIGASAPVWVALSHHVRMIQGKKWGSGRGWGNREMILETKVDVDVSALARPLWLEMERLRVWWRERLQGAQ